MSLSSIKKQIEKLNTSHDLENFDYDVSELNTFLNEHALQNQNANSTKTYVVCEEKRALGYYSLAVGSALYAKAPNRITRGLAKHPVPVMILTRLAVGKTQQGIGKGLLKDALLRTLQASDIVGIRSLLVHAKDETAKQWYQQFDFDPGPTDPLHLYLLLKDIKKAIRSEQ